MVIAIVLTGVSFRTVVFNAILYCLMVAIIIKEHIKVVKAAKMCLIIFVFIILIIESVQKLQYKFHNISEVTKTEDVMINATRPLDCLKYNGANIKILLHNKFIISRIVDFSDILMFDIYFTHFLLMSGWIL